MLKHRANFPTARRSLPPIGIEIRRCGKNPDTRERKPSRQVTPLGLPARYAVLGWRLGRHLRRRRDQPQDPGRRRLFHQYQPLFRPVAPLFHRSHRGDHRQHPRIGQCWSEPTLWPYARIEPVATARMPKGLTALNRRSEGGRCFLSRDRKALYHREACGIGQRNRRSPCGRSTR